MKILFIYLYRGKGPVDGPFFMTHFRSRTHFLKGDFIVKLNFNTIIAGAITAALGVALFEYVLKPMINKSGVGS